MPVAHALLGDGDVGGQRRPAERGEIERQDDVPVGQPRRDRARRIELDPVPLAVIDGQCDHRKTRLAREAGADHRIEPAREKHDRLAGHSFSPSFGAAQNITA